MHAQTDGRMSNHLDPEQGQLFVGPELGPDCL